MLLGTKVVGEILLRFGATIPNGREKVHGKGDARAREEVTGVVNPAPCSFLLWRVLSGASDRALSTTTSLRD